jgi:hypothetical protein
MIHVWIILKVYLKDHLAGLGVWLGKSKFNCFSVGGPIPIRQIIVSTLEEELFF